VTPEAFDCNHKEILLSIVELKCAGKDASSMISTVSQIKLFKRKPEGYLGPGEDAPTIADSSDDSENDTMWKQSSKHEIIGSEVGSGLQVHASFIPVHGGPFSALVPSMWPQDILACIQQTEDEGSHPDCEYDEFGNCVDPAERVDAHDPDPESFVTSEDPSQRLKWIAFLESTQNHIAGDLTWEKVGVLSKSIKLKELVYAGVPHSMRIHVWPRISGSLEKKAKSKVNYRNILKKCEGENSLEVKQIEKDLCRTMPNNACFQAQDGIGTQKLKRILICIAYLYPDIGYCQGVGMIVCALLLFLEEEDAFWVMCAIIEDLLPHSYFSSTLIGVQADQRVLRQLIVSYLPELDTLLKEHDIELSLITLHWFLTLMASLLPLTMLLRVWDIFFYEGSIALFRITLGMLRMKQPAMLTLENSAQIFNALSDLPGEVNDPEELIQASLHVSASLTDVVLEAHRKKHVAFLMNEVHKSSQATVSSPVLLKNLKKIDVSGKNSWLSALYHYGPMTLASQFCSSNFQDSSSFASKAKNIKQTEMLSDLREAMLLIAKHFKSTEAKKVLEVDYSVDSHAKDYENYLKNARQKLRRAKAIVDFERHEDDELGFRKHDIITIISQKDDHCWIGELNGLRGWFPAKFVHPLDERSKEYSMIGDDTVNEAVTDLVRGHLCTSLGKIFHHGLRTYGIFGTISHPWLFIEEASKFEVQEDFNSVYSRLVLCKSYRLDVDGKVLSPEELLYRAVETINCSHDRVGASMDVKFRSFICYGLNEQVMHLWFEVLCLSEDILAKWYLPQSFLRSPAWIQIKCELRSLALFSFRLSIDWEIARDIEQPSVNMKEDVQDMLVKHHLFSWDL